MWGKEEYLEIPGVSIVWPLLSERCSKQIIHTEHIPIVLSVLRKCYYEYYNHAHLSGFLGINSNSILIHLLGLTPSDIKEFLQPIIDEEGSLEGNFDKRPKLTVSDREYL